MLYLTPVGLSSALPLLTLPIFTRLLTPTDYGLIALATVYAMTVSGLANVGLLMSLERNYFVYDDEPTRGRLFWSCFLVVAGLLAVAAALTWAFRAAISEALLKSPAHGPLIMAALMAAGLQGLRQYMLMLFRNAGEAVRFVRFSVIESLVGTGASLVLVALVRLGPLGIPLGQAVGSALTITMFLPAIVARFRPALDVVLLREALKLGVPMTPRVLLGVLANQLDKYLLGLLSTLGVVGLYSIGQKLAYLVFTFMTALENVFAPRVIELSMKPQHQQSVGRYLTPFAYASVGLALTIVLFSEELLRLVVTPEFYAAIPIVNILAVFYAGMFFGKQKQLLIAKKTHLIPLITAISVGLNVAISIPLIRNWGPLGAALANLIAGIVGGTIATRVGQHYQHIDYETGKLTVIFGVLAVGAAVITGLYIAGTPYAVRLPVKLAFLILYLGVGWNFNFITRQLGTHLRQLKTSGSLA